MITQEQLEYLLNHGLTTEMIEKITADLAQLDKQAIGREYKQMKRNNMSTHSILPIFWTDEQRQAEKSARSNRQSVDVGWRLPVFEAEAQPAPVSDGVKAIWKEVERQLKNKNRGRSDYPLAQHVRSEMDKLIKELK